MNGAQETVPYGSLQFPASLLCWGARCSLLARGPACFYLFVCSLHFIQLQIAEPLNIYQLVSSCIHGPDQFIELQIDGAGIAILSALDQQDHQKGRNTRSCVDGLCPGLREMKDRSSGGPHHDHQARGSKRPRRAEPAGNRGSESSEVIVNRPVLTRNWDRDWRWVWRFGCWFIHPGCLRHLAVARRYDCNRPLICLKWSSGAIADSRGAGCDTLQTVEDLRCCLFADCFPAF